MLSADCSCDIGTGKAAEVASDGLVMKVGVAILYCLCNNTVMSSMTRMVALAFSDACVKHFLIFFALEAMHPQACSDKLSLKCHSAHLANTPVNPVAAELKAESNKCKITLT